MSLFPGKKSISKISEIYILVLYEILLLNDIIMEKF